MRCLAECIGATRRHAYAHHIQRLMVTGNFALLAGDAPALIEEWYLAVYADAFEWVELPNVHGMVMHADGGRLGSKPYAASAAYINRMSDYCGDCAFDPKVSAGRAPARSVISLELSDRERGRPTEHWRTCLLINARRSFGHPSHFWPGRKVGSAKTG